MAEVRGEGPGEGREEGREEPAGRAARHVPRPPGRTGHVPGEGAGVHTEGQSLRQGDRNVVIVNKDSRYGGFGEEWWSSAACGGSQGGRRWKWRLFPA